MKKIKVEAYPATANLNFIQDMTIGFRTILDHPYLIQLVLLAMLINMLFGLMTGSAPIMVAGIYHKTDHYYAVLNLTAGIFGTVMIVLFNYILRFISIIQIGFYTFLLACMSCILLGFTHSYITYLIVYAFFFGINGLFSIFFRSERVRIISHEVLGRTIGTIIFTTFLLFPVSGLLISMSQKFIGLQHLIMLFGFLCLILSLPILNKIYAIKNEFGSDYT